MMEQVFVDDLSTSLSYIADNSTLGGRFWPTVTVDRHSKYNYFLPEGKDLVFVKSTKPTYQQKQGGLFVFNVKPSLNLKLKIFNKV